MAIAIGGHTVAADNTSSTTTTSGVTTQASGSNFYIIVSYPNGDTISGGAPTDNKSNTYTLLSGMSFDDTSDGYLTKVFECKNGAGGSGHTATLTLDSTDRKCIYFVEVTGADTSSSIDQSSIARDASSPFDGTALTTTNANDLIFAFLRSSDIVNSTFTLNGSFTQVDINSTTTASILGSRTVSATGTYSPAATATGGTAAVVALWAVKQAATGGTTTTKTMTETLTVADAALRTAYRVRQASDAIVTADAFTDWLQRVRAPLDTITLSDGDTYRFSIITATEAVDVVDGFTKALSGAGIVYAKVMSDTLTVIDDAGQRWRLRFSQLTDAIGLSDQVQRSLRAIRALGDSIEFADGTVSIRRFCRLTEDDLMISDERISTLILYQLSNTSFVYGAAAPPFRFGGN